ncbi:MAG: CapA family protein, partial [Acidobacteria bacterium]|nr:CapA family protein [Acidobacteriota bacterium]
MSVVRRFVVVCAIVMSFVALAWVQDLTAQARKPVQPVAKAPAPLAAAPAPAADNSMTIALTGDSIITQKLSVHSEPQFLKMIEMIRGADVAFANLEMLFHDYEPYPMTQSGGTYMRADPTLAKELAWAGFDIVGRANNHVNDYGVEGMRLTTKYTAAAGLVQAGVGESLEEAREAKYLDTGKGRVALISVVSTFPDPIRAGRSWGDTRARPGLNPLRFTTTYVVTRQQFDSLRSALAAVGRIRGGQPATTDQPVTQMTVFGNRFVVGDKQETRTEPLKEDLDEIAAVVRNASRMADYTIVSFHTHEGGANRFTPPQFLVTFAHAMVDAGADILTGSGPHVLRGIEIYKGKPILYSIGDFMFQNETLLRMPPENYMPVGLARGAGVADFNDSRYDMDRRSFPADEYIWESVIAMPRFVGKTLAELKLYPI